MMRERELSSLMIQAGLERGIGVEQVVEELLAMPVPSFVDSQVFRDSLLEAVEAHLLGQVADRMQRLRQRFGLEPRTQAPSRVEAPVDSAPTMIDQNAVTAAEIQTTGRAFTDDLPGDATMVWTTLHGRDSE
jgi:hypothetical protein